MPHTTKLRRDQFFYNDAIAHRNMAIKLLDTQLDAAFLPYDKAKYQKLSLFYPVCHAAKIVVSGARIVYGTLILVGAIFVEPRNRMPEILKGLLSEAITILAHVINIIASIASIVTRNLSTLFNLGYAYSKSLTATPSVVLAAATDEAAVAEPKTYVDSEYGSINDLEENTYVNSISLKA